MSTSSSPSSDPLSVDSDGGDNEDSEGGGGGGSDNTRVVGDVHLTRSANDAITLTIEPIVLIRLVGFEAN